MPNNIKAAEEAKNKLKEAWNKRYSDVPCAIGIGIDHMTGKYTLEVRLQESKYYKIFPEILDGFPVNVSLMGSPQPRQD